MYKDDYNIIIQTIKGDIPIQDIIPGDKVYDFQTSDELEIIGVKRFRMDDIYRVDFTDKRFSYFSRTELIYIGELLKRTNDIIKYRNQSLKNSQYNMKSFVGNLKSFPIDYYKNRTIQPLQPDPYISGAFFMHGNFDNQYINLPITRAQATPFLFSKYHITFANKLESNMLFFRFEGFDQDSVITWREFYPDDVLPQIGFYIPLRYMRSSINDRWQFIRGAFDLAYDSQLCKNTLSIKLPYSDRLYELQKMLWSLGVFSVINKEILTVHTNPTNYPGFFYNVKIANEMHRLNLFIRNCPEFKLQISNITWQSMNRIPRLVTNKPNQIYLMDNFLTRITY